MAQDCPNCGHALDLSERTIRIQVGECGDCHHTYSFVPHGAPVEAGATAPEGEPTMPGITGAPPNGTKAGAKAEGDDDETPVCGKCGSDLVFRAADDVTIEVQCTECEEVTRFRAESAAPAPSMDRPPERSEGFRDRRDRGPRPPPSEGFRARGCRRCGGVLDFESLPDGGRVGRCQNCGNEFRLPPRRDGPGDYNSRPRRSYGSDRGGGRSYDRRGPPRRGPPRPEYGGGGDRRRRRRDDDE